MKRATLTLSLLGISTLIATGVVLGQGSNERGSNARGRLIANAVSAAPAAIGRGATIMAPAPRGGMETLRRGNNGWTCMPNMPETPGNDPMCLDANGVDWAHAWMSKRLPTPGKVGLAYMLQGGSDASNLDPHATRPARGERWVTTGPHVMILSHDAAAQSGYPTREARPDTSRPYIMFGGTPYQHIMMPVQ